jgi:gamma-glutamyltranspeptidase/glutathione hydrolase
MFKGADGKPTEASRIGALSVGVPGSVAGLFEAYQKLASKKKTWAELVEPSIRLARDGFVVDAGFAQSVAQAEKVLARFPASAKLFLPNGAPPLPGSLWRSAELGDTLERIARGGPAGFYEGVTAALVEKTMATDHGLVNAADLAAYRPVWRAPIAFEYRGKHVVSMPPPSPRPACSSLRRKVSTWVSTDRGPPLKGGQAIRRSSCRLRTTPGGIRRAQSRANSRGLSSTG